MGVSLYVPLSKGTPYERIAMTTALARARRSIETKYGASGGSTGVVRHNGETGFRTDASDNAAQFPARRSLGLGIQGDNMRYTLFKMIRSEIGRIRAQRLNFRSTNI
jgi:hypothetical protein